MPQRERPMTDIRPLIEPVLQGHSHADVIEALSSLLGQAIADSAETPEGAATIAVGMGRAIGHDIIKNWSLVRARRAQADAKYEYNPAVVREILAADALPQEATFDNVEDMLHWLES